MGIGAKIKELRMKANLTQKDLADKLCLTYQAISRWENDEVEPSFDAIKQMCKFFNCTTDELLGVEHEEVDVIDTTADVIKEESITEENNEDEEESYICEYCNKIIKNKNDLVRREKSHTVRKGRRHHTVYSTVTLCKECAEEEDKEEEARAIAIKNSTKEEFKKKRIKSFIWGGIVGLFFLICGIYNLIEGNEGGWETILTAFMAFTFVSCLILNNNFIGEMWCEIASWGFVQLPGVIFDLSIDGLIFLIVVKVGLAILGFLLALLCVIFATILGFILSIFVYPFALGKNIKLVDE